MLKTTKRLLIVFLLITIILILLFGVYRIYEVFYPAYFNQTEYEQIAFIGNTEMPTKYEVLFSGFREVRVMLTSTVFSFLLIYGSKLIRKKQEAI